MTGQYADEFGATLARAARDPEFAAAYRRQLYLARQARYNASAKGRARARRYEAAHPERAARWSVIMQVKARDKR